VLGVRRRAFTLLEVLLVIALLVLLTAFMLPDLAGNMERRSLVESADKLRALIVMTQAQCMQDGLKRRIEFPGTPDPLDRHARKEVSVPTATAQPIVKTQTDALNNPDFFGNDVEEQVLREGTRCIAVLVWTAEMYCDDAAGTGIAGPSISTKGETSFLGLTINPDGTTDKLAFVLTDLPPDVEPRESDVGRIIYVVVDSRTGQTWLQRAWRTEECLMMAEYKVSPVLRQDYTRPDKITEANILKPPTKWP
jgi:prepilin-type N-terminal cleavage/methylation domain-containing protein